jgi:hypothetical protein
VGTTITAVLLFVRLRALLFAVCRDHPVAVCESCRQGYKPEELGTELGQRCYLCRRCGTDLRPSLIDHARRCPNLSAHKPPVRITSLPRSQPIERRQRVSA